MKGCPNTTSRTSRRLPLIRKLKIDQPRIYFGEETSNLVYVNTMLKEFDYPKGDTNAQNTYGGR